MQGHPRIITGGLPCQEKIRCNISIVIDTDYVEKMTNNEWVEWNDESFNDGLELYMQSKTGYHFDGVMLFSNWWSTMSMNLESDDIRISNTVTFVWTLE